MKRIRYADGASSELSYTEREFLVTGVWMSAEPEPLEVTLRELWTEHGEALTTKWIVEKALTRPWAWWFIGNHRRRRVRNRAKRGSGENWFGLPQSEIADEGDFESQGAYLEREGQLTVDEKQLLPLSDWQRLGISNAERVGYWAAHRDLLTGQELKALKDHLRRRAEEATSIIQ
jgi:hypothetical protein